MSPLAHHARPHRSPNFRLSVFHRAYALRIGTLSSPHAVARVAKDFEFFAAAQTTVLRCKPRRLCLCRCRSDIASMSPLRAVVSRGHIAFRNHKFVTHSRFGSLGLRETPLDY